MATVDFFGESFELNPEVSEFALLEFSLAAEEGQDGDTKQGMASLLLLVKDCVVASEWGRFRALARSRRAKVSDLMPVITATFEQVAERPTGESTDSSDGLSETPASSESSAAVKASAIFPGRPDKAAAALRSVQSA